jgi:hypothetical protein
MHTRQAGILRGYVTQQDANRAPSYTRTVR